MASDSETSAVAAKLARLTVAAVEHGKEEQRPTTLNNNRARDMLVADLPTPPFSPPPFNGVRPGPHVLPPPSIPSSTSLPVATTLPPALDPLPSPTLAPPVLPSVLSSVPPTPPTPPALVVPTSTPPNPTADVVAPAKFPADTFAFFPFLPAELRLKIWHLSFLPRCVELHSRRTHYADHNDLLPGSRGGIPRWQSRSRNPAAMSVCAESRAAALEVYTIRLPLARAPSATATALPPRTDEYDNYFYYTSTRIEAARPGELLRDTDRVLYINPAEDTVVILGDFHYGRLTKLLEWFREEDEAYQFRLPGRRRKLATRAPGIQRLAMSIALWSHEVGARTLRALSRTVFTDVEEFFLFMCEDRIPPETWTGGRCILEEAEAEDDDYRRFVVGSGKQFRQGDGWMVVGKRPMKVVVVLFLDGW